MNRKQAGIIVTLLVLIAVCGVLATKLNAPLYGLDGNPIIDANNDEIGFTEETAAAEGTFEEFVIKRNTEATQTLNYLMDSANDKNATEEQKTIASENYYKYVMQLDEAKKLETKLKAEGYEDALCFVEDNSVRVYIKTGDALTDDQYSAIRALVASETNIKEVEIAQKKN